MSEREKLLKYIENKKHPTELEFYDLWIDTKNILLHGDLELFYRSRCYAKWPELTREEMDSQFLLLVAKDKMREIFREEYGLG